MKSIGQVVNDTIPKAAHLILMESGIDLSEEGISDSRFDAVAVIGFSGAGFGGALGFAAEKTILKAAYGEMDGPLSDGWIGEVSNQLLGRMKNALLAYGIEIQVAIPMVLHGLGLQVRAEVGKIKQYPYISEVGRACIWVDANWDVAQELSLVAAEEHAQPEGALKMF